MTSIDELPIPEGVGSAEAAHEFVRFWGADGKDHVALRIGAFAPEQEAASWGMIAANIVTQAICGMVQDDPSRDPEVLLAEVERAFRERLAAEAGVAGQLGHGPAS